MIQFGTGPVEAKEKSLEEKEYRYWRIRIFYSMFVGYIFFYFTRRSFSSLSPEISADLGFTKADLGYISTTLMAITYAIGKLTGGVVADRTNPRYFMAFCLIISGVLNLLVGFSSSLLMFAILWGINGWFQGGGFPPCARMLTSWYAKRERAGWWSCWATSHNVGALLTSYLVVSLVENWGWRQGMIGPGIMGILMGLFLMNRLRGEPESVGLPNVEVFKGNGEAPIEEAKEEKEKELGAWAVFVRYVITNQYVWLFGIAVFFVYLIRQGMVEWGPWWLMESQGFQYADAQHCYTYMEKGGLIGMLASGFLSDYIFRGKREPMLFILMAGMAAVMGLFLLFPSSSYWFNAGLMFSLGIFIYGPQMLLGIAVVEYVPRNAVGTAVGFVTGFIAYAGTALAGGPLASLIEGLGYTVFFQTLFAGALAGTLCMLIPLVKGFREKKLVGATA